MKARDARDEPDEPRRRSGRLVVRMPRGLHVAIAAEAEREGVSLNQLIVAKLATLTPTWRPKS